MVKKIAFIGKFPLSVSAKKVVEEGKKAGLKFDAAYVYKTRWLHRKRRGRVTKRVRVSPADVKKMSCDDCGHAMLATDTVCAGCGTIYAQSKPSPDVQPSTTEAQTGDKLVARQLVRQFRSMVLAFGIERSKGIVADLERGLRRLVDGK
jgi:hypothetical protein